MAGSKAPKPAYFTGRVQLKDVSSDSGRTRIYRVEFFGARTKVHYHTGPQILIPLGGSGALTLYERTSRGKSAFGIKKTGRIMLKPGGATYVPARKLHAHGAAGRGKFSHIAINLPAPGGAPLSTFWFESDFKKNITSRI